MVISPGYNNLQIM